MSYAPASPMPGGRGAGRRAVAAIANPDPQRLVVALGLLALAALAAYLGAAAGWRQAALAVIGAGLGLALYHAAFGFTAAYRHFILRRRGAGLRAQLVMLAIATLVFAPLLGAGEAFGRPLGGAIAPIGVSLLVGAFVFGLGMQLASGCASGTLYTVGGGSTRMVLTLAAFIVGSYVGTWHFVWWQEQPKLDAVALYRDLGWAGGLALQLAAFGALYGIAVLFERRRHRALDAMADAPAGLAPRRFLARLTLGPWPMLWGGVALALLNIATLLIAGRPWGVTWAFALWGGKLASLIGDEPARHAFWRWPAPQAALERGLQHDITSVMNLGIVLGALIAAGLAGRFAPSLRIGGRSALAAVIGGLLLGYGARLAYGCNIGAFFSGVASGSVHGWVWLVLALAGTFIGVWLRPYFGLANETDAGSKG